VAVPAHEVGNALQHRLGYSPLRWRTLLATLAMTAQRLGNGLFLLAPLAAAVTHAPISGLILLATGYLSEDDCKKARQILTAAALSYVAGSLASLLNLWRWLRWIKP
jgi:Zn-dependent membrane protease YugP